MINQAPDVPYRASFGLDAILFGHRHTVVVQLFSPLGQERRGPDLLAAVIIAGLSLAVVVCDHPRCA